jgi:solute carrier family 13 (sodium-dependent dicarboxylate transporter), member 2/3/5
MSGRKDQLPDETQVGYPREDLEQTDMFKPFLKRRRTWLVIAAFALLAGAVHLLPVDWHASAMQDLDPASVRIGLGILACIAFLWLSEALPLAATALMVPLLAALLGVSDMKSSLANFADPLIFLFLGGFALASAMAYQGVDRWIAQRLILLANGGFLQSAVLLFAVTAFLSMWMSNTATTAMMIPLALGVLGRMGGEGGQAGNVRFLLLGLAYSASIGGLGTIIGSPPNGIAAKQLGISFAEWLRFGVPAVLLLLPVMITVLYLLCRPGRNLKIPVQDAHFTFNWHRRMTVLIFAVTATLWMCGGKLGPLLGIAGAFDTAVALTAILALLYFRVVRWRDIDRGTEWGVLLLFGGGLALSGVMRDTGVSLFLARLLTESIHSWSLPLVIGAVVMFVIFLTEISSNTATAALLVPIFHAVGGELGIAPAMLVIPLALAASCAFMLPVATPPNAIVFATGRVPQRAMMRNGIVLNLVFSGLLTLLSMLLLK